MHDDRCGDAFDLFCHFEHGGDYTSAVRGYSEEAGLQGQADENVHPFSAGYFQGRKFQTGSGEGDEQQDSEGDEQQDNEGDEQQGSEGPHPLLREIPPGEPYPVEALGPLRGAVEAAHDMTKAPGAIAGQSALSVASLAVQAFGDVETLGGYAPLSLYCLTVAKSGERKSATDKVLMAGLREFEREQSGEYREEMQSWRNAHAIWKADHEKIMGEFKKKSGNRVSAQADLDALGAEPPAPLAPNLTATEPTLEGLHKLFVAGQPSLGVFSDEGGQFLGGHGMSADNRLKTIAGLSALWGGDAINRTRAGDGAITLYGRRLAAHLMVQPIAARPLLADPVATGQGFLARFLISEPPSTIGTRLQRGHAESSNVAVSQLSQHLQAALHTPKPCSEDNPQELVPRQLPLSVGAKE